MSPEQVNGQKVDGRCDIFSLGGVLYEMLTGHPPFEGEELAAVLYQILNGDPPPPSTVQASLPAELDRLVAKAMAKDAALRYQDAGEFAHDLRRCQRQLLGTDAAAVDAADSGPAAAIRGRRTMRWTIATGVLAGVVAVTWLAVGSRDSIPPATAVPQPVPVPEVVSGLVVEPVVRPAGNEPDAARRIAAVKPAVTGATAAAKPRLPTTGKLTLAISPWGEVRVDGKPAGIAPPLTELKVAAGRHRIEIRNGGFPPYRQTIQVAGGATVRIKHKFK
jgi:serine/threonine-protein kinase